MCGIFGVLGPVASRDGVATRLADAIRHRGPDDSGVFSFDGGIIGANRLSIVDIANGKQPMRRSLRGRSAVIVYNGEIFNIGELRQALAESGVEPTTRSDTEIVLLCYLTYGRACLDHLNGQFAFAIWDESKRELFAARDHAGIKPFFYAIRGKTLVFASEPKALFASGLVAREPDQVAIAEYLLHGHAFASGYTTGERTFYAGVRALPPSQWLSWSPSEFSTGSYWQPPEEAQQEVTNDQWRDRIRAVLDRRIVDYVPGECELGVALSGGVDSSAIAALATREINSRGRDLVACTISYAGGQENADLDHARMVIDMLRARGHRVRFDQSVLTPDDYLTELDLMLQQFDEPHWEVKQLAMFRNYRRLKECGAKVVLTGEGADELFYGYYLKFPGFTNPRLQSGQELKDHWRKRVPHVLGLFHTDVRAQLEVTVDQLIEESVSRYYEARATTSSPEKRMQHWYFRTFLPWLLTVNDRCSMAFSLEGRFPFLDKDLISLAFEMPAQLNTTGVGKTVMRDAFRDILPAAVVDRPKAPLPSPIDARFHETVAEAFLGEIDRSHDSDCWKLLSRDGLSAVGQEYQSTLRGLNSPDAEPLVSYLYLNQPLAVRTPQVFAQLSLLRWWAINFENG